MRLALVPALLATTLPVLALRGADPAPAAPACQQAPEAPTGLGAPALTATTITLRWQPVPAVPGCRATYAVNDNGRTVASGLAAPAAVLRGLEPGSVHLLFVTARNQAGSSSPSVGLALRTRTAADPEPTPGQVLGHPEGGPDRPDLP